MDTTSTPLFFSSPSEGSTPGLTPAQFNALCGTPNAPRVLDVRRRPRFDESPLLLAGAQYCAPENVAAFARQHPVGRVVVYCVYGHNVSAEAVAELRQAGWDAVALQGGIDGGEDGVDTPQNLDTWRSARPLRLQKRPDWGVTGLDTSRWVTRERPKIDRIACPWLIRRFIDPRAEFFYAPTAQVFQQAQALHAVAYDIPGAPVSHDGDRCSFDCLLQGFAHHDPALDLLATIVRGADTDCLDLAAQSAGLLAISLGFSRLYVHDDHAMLEAALPVYDALYAWCRDRVGTRDQMHSWNPESMLGAQA